MKPHEGQLAQGAVTAQPGAPSQCWFDRLMDLLRGGRTRRQDAAEELYQSLVAQARQPVFYTAYGVPDSRDGRLEMVSLHAILVMRRLRDEGRAGQALAQRLFDVMFVDLDHHVREWGVGDLSVGKHVKKLAQSFLGQAAALDPVLAARDSAALADLLRRNVYSEVADPAPAAVAQLAAYLLRQERWLAEQPAADLLAGTVHFAAAAP